MLRLSSHKHFSESRVLSAQSVLTKSLNAVGEILFCGSFLGESQLLLKLSYSFLLKSSGKDKLYFSTLRASVGLLFTPMLTTKKQDPHHLPYIKHDHLDIDQDSGFQSSYRNA